MQSVERSKYCRRKRDRRRRRREVKVWGQKRISVSDVEAFLCGLIVRKRNEWPHETRSERKEGLSSSFGPFQPRGSFGPDSCMQTFRMALTRYSCASARSCSPPATGTTRCDRSKYSDARLGSAKRRVEARRVCFSLKRYLLRCLRWLTRPLYRRQWERSDYYVCMVRWRAVIDAHATEPES